MNRSVQSVVSWWNHCIFLSFSCKWYYQSLTGSFLSRSRSSHFPEALVVILVICKRQFYCNSILIWVQAKVYGGKMGETPNTGQDGRKALEMHREVHTGWESRLSHLGPLRKEKQKIIGFYHIHASYVYELLYYLLVWSFNAAFQIIPLYHKPFRSKYHEISIFIFWLFKPTLRLVELRSCLNFGHCATCKEISSKKDAHIKVFSLSLSAKYFCI